jgi:hypothetical protein
MNLKLSIIILIFLLTNIVSGTTNNIVQWNEIHEFNPNSVDNKPYNLAVNDPGYNAEGLIQFPSVINTSSALHIYSSGSKTITVNQVNSFTSSVTWNTRPSQIRTLVSSYSLSSGWNVIYLNQGYNIQYIHLVGNGGSCCVNLLSGNTAYIEYLNTSIFTMISNDTYGHNNVSVLCDGCANINYGNDTSLEIGSWDTGDTITYIDLTQNYLNDTGVSLYLYQIGSDGNNSINIYSTTIFNESNLTYNNKPNAISLLGTQYLSNGWNIINISSFNRYIFINTTTAKSFYSSEYSTEYLRPYIASYYLPNPPTLSGYTKFIDVNGTIYSLPFTQVRLNSTTTTTSDTNGYYEFVNINYNIYNMTASKNNAYSIKNQFMNFTSTNTNLNFTLNFSKPSLTTPFIQNNLIESIYSHNFKTIQLWENPYFVWGIYDYNGTIQKQVCTYKLNNTFACDLLPGKYKFNMSYSDVYNYNLATWHPTLSGNRTFNTAYIYIEDGQLINNIINNKLPKATRESTLSSNLITYLFIMFIVILVIYTLSFNHKRRQLKVYER